MKDWNWENIPQLAVNGSHKKSLDFLRNLYEKLVTEYSPEQIKISIISSSPDIVIDKKYLYSEPVTNQNSVADLLIRLDQEILCRYQTFSSAGVKNIKEYNTGKNKIPYIFVLIDDLMKLSESIDQINHLMARAAGIYTVGCTENFSELPMLVRSRFQVENV